MSYQPSDYLPPPAAPSALTRRAGAIRRPRTPPPTRPPQPLRPPYRPASSSYNSTGASPPPWNSSQSVSSSPPAVATASPPSTTPWNQYSHTYPPTCTNPPSSTSSLPHRPYSHGSDRDPAPSREPLPPIPKLILRAPTSQITADMVDAESPVLRAGGGNPSSYSLSQHIPSFTPAILQHLETIFTSITHASNTMDKTGVQDFLHKIQYEPLPSQPGGFSPADERGNVSRGSPVSGTTKTPSTAAALPEGILNKPVNGLDDFLMYMSSPASSWLRPHSARQGSQAHHFSYPMSSYFISTSHNTYLTGNQLYSDSSTDTYRDVLLRGCRCLEIDVWDGEPPSNSSSDIEDDASSIGSKSPSKSKFLDKGAELFDRFAKRAQSPRRGSSPGRSPSPHKRTSSTASTVAAAATLASGHGMPTPWKTAISASRAEPVVLHGYTLTSEVPFRAVCVAIRDTAFVSSSLPIIVSLEVHASLEQQEVMIEIMKEEWKGLLIETPLSVENVESLPSPLDLKRKILIKVKWQAQSNDEDSALASDLERITTADSDDERVPPASASGQSQKKAPKLLPALSAMGVYTSGHRFKSLSQPEASIPNHIFSLSEQGVQKVQETNGYELFAHNKNFFMRAFPSGMRVTSSNLDPAFFWRQGIQMVALNWQRWDKGMMLNEGMFAGEEGWVLKPDGYRGARRGSPSSTSTGPDGSVATNDLEAIVRHTVTLTIELFAGQNIPLPTGDENAKHFHPYIKCQLHVEKPEERVWSAKEQSKDSNYENKKKDEYKKRSKTSKGTDPDFYGERLHFDEVAGVVEELSFVRIKISDDEFGKDDLAAWACVRLDRLQQGYRFIHLLDAKGCQSNGVLLVRITKSMRETT